MRHTNNERVLDDIDELLLERHTCVSTKGSISFVIVGSSCADQHSYNARINIPDWSG